jgi:hypothetical protein
MAALIGITPDLRAVLAAHIALKFEVALGLRMISRGTVW